MASIDLQDVRKSYGDNEVIHGIDGHIADGEFVVIVGASGCGKSTLLRMIAGLEKITSGEIRIGERVVNGLEPSERDIAMVFQNYALYPHMSVARNMAYSLRIRGLAKAEIERKVREAAEILEITEYLERKPRQLSGGQRQRVAMGRAIVRDPAVFLFDEPLSNLDAKLRVQMRLEIRRLQERLGTTSVYVTHDQVEAMTVGDRLMVLNGGRVEQFASPIEIYRRPASAFVAGFIGSPSMNFLPVELDGGVPVFEDGTRLPAVEAADRSSGPVTLGIRPEALREEAGGNLAVTVGMLEQLGANTLLHGAVGRGEHPLTIVLEGIRELEGGSTVRFAVDPGAAHLFDRESGVRLN
jgi:sn-glycerol 3-phosphate transport system ATP-binding protein